MSSPDAVERALPEGGARPSSRPPRVLTWQGVEPTTLESVRLLVGDTRLRASGRVIAAGAPGQEPYSASFEASVDKSETAGRLLLRTTTADKERQISLSRTEDGMWLVDHGSTSNRDAFAGAVAVDVAGAVTFASLPIRRLGLHRAQGEAEIPVVAVTMPGLEVALVTQSYRTVSVDEAGAVIAVTRGETTVEIAVDADGIVVDFPGVSRRV
ncbi:putative glycolipid-binding domain-containing protein [Actinokineospora pegani]|uniref:putative glycolipid-binding domain-containing protein n=1 Tax=Actinokineospora pegani TaxID=2654637 RepID=UPI0012E9E03D|nr:putative glycolipid-binding domain-containing protein [Actinokineospora pegani]